MPDKKLTDAEIIKALEEHYEQVEKGYTDHLAYGGKGDEHEEKYIYMLRDVFDLINRLKEENERLQEAIDEQDIEISRLYKRIDEAKAEAYKEFAERLKGNYIGITTYYDLKNDIDNLLKELVEGVNNA